MNGTIKSTLAERRDAVTVPVQISNKAEQALIRKFDATRIPMPAVAVLAPNGAVCSVFPQKVTSHQLTAAIVSRGQASCLKALQDKKIVVLCAQPAPSTEIPVGVRQFQADKLYSNRTEVVRVTASDPNEAKFLKQLRVPTTKRTPVVAFMAPPGVISAYSTRRSRTRNWLRNWLLPVSAAMTRTVSTIRQQALSRHDARNRIK